MQQPELEQEQQQEPTKRRRTADDKRQEVLKQLRERNPKSLSREQRLAIYIDDLQEPTREDKAMLRTLLDAERSAITARRKKAEASRIYQDQVEKQRRERTRRLIELGGLVDVAGVQETDPALLVGILASINALSDHDKDVLKEQGRYLLQHRKTQKKAP